MKLDNEVFERWKLWIDKIKKDLQDILINQQIFCEIRAIAIQANWSNIEETYNLLFCNFIKMCYSAQATVGIRRHLKNNKNSISLKRLMVQIKNCSSQFTYDFYLQQHPATPQNIHWQKTIFSDFSHDGITVADDIINADIQNLETLGKKVEDYVDRQLAHLDKKDWNDEITCNELENIVDRLSQLTKKYLNLITGDFCSHLAPQVSCDLKSIFRTLSDIQNQE
ncbi:MAG: hypothetical protein JW715_04775 [Sedimentisphaerales bacterium]|nr:hypothetical protein [Sedimentisphaerales bacterium]